MFAVIRAIEVIGEASKTSPDDLKEKYPEVPWKGMARMRNKKRKNLIRTICEKSGNLWGNRLRPKVLVARLLCKSVMII
ncbi:MAG: DUF86 domain-containing protein [Candidatus Freyrarchaeum guaymaensis]